MRINPSIFLKAVTIIFATFAVLGFTVAIIAGTDIIRAISALLLFATGYIAAIIHLKL
jgi:hypothetical protein